MGLDAKRTNGGPENMLRTAVVSDDEIYRYHLTRQWSDGGRNVLWIMLNPSTADAENDDPTIRRCIGFSKAWGFDSLTVCNLFALRCTKPTHLEHHPDPEGPLNVEWLVHSMERAEKAVLAWGANAMPRTARGDVIGMVKAMLRTRAIPTFVLGLTSEGHPRHPLYVRADVQPAPIGLAA